MGGGKLYQNKNGYGSTDTGYYARATSLSNTNGWVVTWKVRIAAAPNTSGEPAVNVLVYDGTKAVQIILAEHFIQSAAPGVGVDATVQVDCKTKDHVFTLCGKGSDYYLFLGGKLIVDGTGKLTTATATNEIRFGDTSATASVNADVVWDYVKDYNTAWLPPQFTSGSCSEAAFFSGDRTGILSSLYNGGTLKSVREYCGVGREYVEQVPEIMRLRGITSNPTTTSTSATVLPDMETFMLVDKIECATHALIYNSLVTSWAYLAIYIDGTQVVVEQSFGPNANANSPITVIDSLSISFGLHKVESRWYVGSGTGSSQSTDRRLIVEFK